MAERRPKNQGLERVLGTGALFSTAYGNVGSSIYYALGLVAIYALGMTPIVFLISGLIFAATAATYAEATARNTFSLAASFTPTTFTAASNATITMPPMMSPGPWRRAGQKTPR